jgi:N-methylhydantoinase A
MSATCDPVTLEIIRGAIRAAQAEMEALLERTAISAFIREKKDFYTALFDADGVMAVGSNVPIFGDICGPVFEHFPKEGMKPGDLYWYSDCYGSRGAVSHSNDQVFLAPVFHEGRRCAFVMGWAHFSDVGGIRPGSISPDATSIFQEGIIIPPTKLIDAGLTNEATLAIFFRNSRYPAMCQGDTRALMACVDLGVKRMQEIIVRFSPDMLEDALAQLLARTEALVRRRLRETFPVGTHRFTDAIDTDGHGSGPIRIRFALTRTEDDRFIFDATETDDQSVGPVNFLMNRDVPGMALGLYFLGGDPTQVCNAGGPRALDEVRLREGSLLRPRFPAPLGMRGLTMMRVLATLHGLINVAGTPGLAAHSAYVILMMSGTVGGKHFLMSDGIGVGYGARPEADGIDTVYFVAQENYPVEFLELGYPVRLTTYGVHRDSGGAGTFRGGCGIVREYEILADEATLAVRIDSVVNPPWGVAGGMSGGVGRAVVNPGRANERVLKPLSDGNKLRKGDVLRMETGGGGGRGHPYDRPAALVLRDVLEGYVSVEAAARAPAAPTGRMPARSTARGMSMLSPDAMLSVAVDIGGTFTDVTLQNATTGEAWRAKTPSVPSDPSAAFITGVRLALAAAGAEASSIGRVLHGTTVATNMILEGKGAATALVTTAGFRHVLDIGRQDIPRRANLYAWVKPRRPVPASHVLEVVERVGAGGIVLTPLDEASVAEAAEACRRLGVRAVAVCLLHSFAHPAHERRVAEILRAALPGVAVTISADVLPVVREYERTLAVILNAGVMPAVSTYVARLEERLTEAGIAAPLLLMQSNGGVAGAATIRRAPAVTALSGPAAGVVGAREVAAAAGIADIVTVDIGGTSADICLIKGGRIGLTQHGKVGEWPLPLPMVDMVTVGAGGGSIARVADGALSVGPASAGAVPGPACYGQGGADATVTDAHIVLGHLPPSLLGGRMRLDPALAEQAVRRQVADPLGLDLHAAARGILAIADNNMVGAIRVVSVERGHDPRDFTLVPFGGAGPLHGCALADLLGIATVLVPPAPGVLCAEGLLAADLKAEFSRTLPRAGTPDEGEVVAIVAGLRDEAANWLAEERVPEADRRIETFALMRYAGQGGELAVPWTGAAATASAAFDAAHRSLYGFVLVAPIELVTLRVEATGRLPAPVMPEVQPGAAPAPIGSAVVHFAGGSQEAAIYDRGALPAGARLRGPLIVTQLDATTLVPPGWDVEVHVSGAMLLRRDDFGVRTPR